MIVLTGIIAVANLILALIVLIKLFQKEGVGKGILGFICMLYTFIWGWQNREEQNITNVMYAWTACIVINMVLGALANASA